MRPPPFTSTLSLSLALLALTTPTTAQSILAALVAAGASEFAGLIQSDPGLLETYTSGRIKTVFAPKDLCYGAAGEYGDCAGSGNDTVARRALSEDESEKTKQAYIAGSEEEQVMPSNSIKKKRGEEGGVVGKRCSGCGDGDDDVEPFVDIETVEDGTNLGDLNTTLVIVFEAGESAGCSGGGHDRRRMMRSVGDGAWKRGYGGGDDYCDDSGAITYKVVSGLGSMVKILEPNIPFDDGLIHLVDDYMTIPRYLSETASMKGWTEYLALIHATHLQAEFDTIPLTTFFVPSNEAIQDSCLDEVGKDEKERVLREHTVTDFFGLSTRLEEGQTLENLNGNDIVVEEMGGDTYVNGVKILKFDILVDNGVAIVIDGLLTTVEKPTAPAYTPSVSTVTVTEAPASCSATGEDITYTTSLMCSTTETSVIVSTSLFTGTEVQTSVVVETETETAVLTVTSVSAYTVTGTVSDTVTSAQTFTETETVYSGITKTKSYTITADGEGTMTETETETYVSTYTPTTWSAEEGTTATEIVTLTETETHISTSTTTAWGTGEATTVTESVTLTKTETKTKTGGGEDTTDTITQTETCTETETATETCTETETATETETEIGTCTSTYTHPPPDTAIESTTCTTTTGEKAEHTGHGGHEGDW
ncbi:hypothetical protein MKZ38_007379 [Zalerion maritima]|uniref:FAS1 domain-containing protein n=1 Tax=Zalerion maritima TaxID=339359 RepID=A0AAD5RHV1_9PEZI|nr:hypothetical protein MKZ38_007379 [Zalerion maritima]